MVTVSMMVSPTKKYWYSKLSGTYTRTISHGYNILTALLTPPSTIFCHHSHSVVTELLQSCQCVLPGSTSHSSGVGVVEPTARSLVGEWHLIAVHNLISWLNPGEGDGCGGLGVNHSDVGSRRTWAWGMETTSCLNILHNQTYNQRMDDLMWSTMISGYCNFQYSLLKHYFHSLHRPTELANDALMKSFHSQQQSWSCVLTQLDDLSLQLNTWARMLLVIHKIYRGHIIALKQREKPSINFCY